MIAALISLTSVASFATLPTSTDIANIIKQGENRKVDVRNSHCVAKPVNKRHQSPMLIALTRYTFEKRITAEQSWKFTRSWFVQKCAFFPEVYGNQPVDCGLHWAAYSIIKHGS